MEPDHRERRARRRDRAIAIGLAVVIVVLLIATRAGGRDPGAKGQAAAGRGGPRRRCRRAGTRSIVV